MNQSPPARIETAIDSSIEPVLHVPIWGWIFIVLCSAAFAAWIYKGERGRANWQLKCMLAALRFSTLVVILWMLCGWFALRFKTEKPELVFVVDTSASMATPDSAYKDQTQLSRIESVENSFRGTRRAIKARLDESYQVRWYSVAAELSQQENLFIAQDEELAADGLVSRLGNGLRQVFDRQTARGTAAVVFLSDGINTSGIDLKEAAQLARESRIPIYACLVGQEQAIPDIRLADLKLAPEVYLGDQIIAEFSVIATNLRDSQVSVRLLDADTGQVLDTKEVELVGENTSLNARLSFVPTNPGLQNLIIEAESSSEELDGTNNSIAAEVDVRDKTIRVLLLQQQPSYEFRFLKSLLDRSTEIGGVATSSFALTSVLQESDPSYVRQDPSAQRLVPSSFERIAEYDVFVIGRFNPALVSRRAQESIFEAVTSTGAGCIFVYGAGEPPRELLGWPLAKLLPTTVASASEPLQLDQYMQWKPSPLGKASPPMQFVVGEDANERIWGALPSFQSVASVGRLKPGAQVLAHVEKNSQVPLLVTQFAGAGRVALQATDETFVWTTINGSDIYHQRYWGQMLRWLSRGRLNKDIEQSKLVIEPKQASFGQSIKIEARLGAEFANADIRSVVVSVDQPDYPRRSLSLNRSITSERIFETTVSDFAPGTHQAILVQPSPQSQVSESFVVSSPPGEQADLRADTENMELLSKQTGGRFYRIEDFGSLLVALPKGDPTRLGALPPKPIWNSPWVAILLVSLLTAEWLLRRKARML